MDDAAATDDRLAPIPLAYYVDAYVAAKRKTGQLGTSGARRARRNFYLFCRLVPEDPRRVRRQHIEHFLERPDVIASHHTDLMNLRGWFDYLVFRGVVSANPTAGVDPPTKTLARRALVRDEATIVADALDRGVLDARSALIISLMFSEGVRRCEIARIRLEDIDYEARRIKVRGSGGSGLVTRAVAISDRTERILALYRATMNRRRGPLVANSLSPGQGVTVAHVGVIARRALESLGLKRFGGDGVTPRLLVIAPSAGF